MEPVKRRITTFDFWDFTIEIYYMNDGISTSGFEYVLFRNGDLLKQSQEEYNTPPLAGIGALLFLEGYYGKKD